jgi:hypothetical protein
MYAEKNIRKYALHKYRRKSGVQCRWFLTEVKYGARTSKFIWAPCVKLYEMAETPQPPLPAFGIIYKGAIGQPR